MLCLPDLRVAASKVLEETVEATGKIELGVVAVVATEARVSKVHLNRIRGNRSTVAMFFFPQSRPQMNAIIATSPATGTTSALRRQH